jgi:hypothetical protein
MAYGAIRGKTGGKDVGQWNPTTEQSAAFESATQGMSPAQKAQLSNLFRSVADREAGELGSSQRMGGTGKSPVQPGDAAKAPAQKARAPMEQGEMAAVKNWLRTQEAQNFLTGQGEMAMTGGGAPASPPQDTDPFMGESPRDQQQAQRNAMIDHIMGLDMQRRHQPAPLPRTGPQVGDYPPRGIQPAPMPTWPRNQIPPAPMPTMPRNRIYDPGFGIQGGSRVNPNPIGQQGPRSQSTFNAFQVPQNRGWLGGY